MKKLHPFRHAALLGVFCLCFATTAPADVRKVALAKTPKVVREAITSAATGSKINSIARRAEDGEVTFEVSVQRNGVAREFSVAADGELLAMEVGLEEVPALARTTMLRVLGTSKAERIDKITENGEPIFEVTFGQTGHEREFTVSLEGVMTRYELGYHELPRALRAAVEMFIATNQLERVDRTFDEGEINYDVQFTTNGETRVLTVGTNAVVSRIEVGLSETPKAVQQAIKAQLKGWKLGDIDKVLDDDEVTYEVEATKGRTSRNFTVDASGKLISETIELSQTPAAVRQSILSRVASGKLLRVERNYEDDGTISFDVEAKRDGKSIDFSVGADGKIIVGN